MSNAQRQVQLELPVVDANKHLGWIFPIAPSAAEGGGRLLGLGQAYIKPLHQRTVLQVLHDE
jgi:hypothetical protein